MDTVSIPGVQPSRELRGQLAGQTVLLAFSRGKDSLAAWLALRDAGCDVIPYHLYLVPGLSFVEESLAYYADWFGTAGPILNVPHPSLYRWLNRFTYQAPERCRVLDEADLPEPDYLSYNDLVREALGLPPDTWVADGVRAADSPNRRMALKQHGPVNHKAHTQKVVWDWKVAAVRSAIARAGVELPPDYEWFGRSFDGLDRRFLGPLKRFAPGDYKTILDWFPLAELDLLRAAL